MRRKDFLMALLILFILVFSAGAVDIPPALAEPGPAAQAGATCDSDVIVQADDSLSTLANKFYGNPQTYPAIFEATTPMQ